MPALNIPAQGCVVVVSHGLKIINPTGERLSLVVVDTMGERVDVEPAGELVRHKRLRPKDD